MLLALSLSLARGGLRCSTKLFLCTVCIGVFWMNASCLNAQKESYQIDRFTKERGLAENLITHLDEDSQQNIWFSTASFLSYYDGSEFKHFSREELGFIEGGNLIFVPDANNLLWFPIDGPESQMHIFDPNNSTISPFDSVFAGIAPFQSCDIAYTLNRDDSYIIYLKVTGQGVYRYNGIDFKLIFSYKCNDSLVVYKETYPYQWFGCKTNTLLRRNRITSIVDTFELGVDIHGLSIRNGELIVISDDYIYQEYYVLQHESTNAILEPLLEYSLAGNPDITSSTSRTDYWFTTKDSIYCLNQENEVVFSCHRFGSENIHKLFNAQDGSVWGYGKNNKGLLRIKKKPLLFHVEFSDVSARGIIQLDSQLFINSYSGQVLIDQRQNTKSINGQISNAISIIQSSEESSILNVRHGALEKYNIRSKEKTTHYAENSRESDFWVAVIHPVSERVYIGGATGLNYLDEEKGIVVFSEELEKFSEQKSVSVRSFLLDGSNIWIATSKGLFLMNEKEEIVNWVSSKDGLPCDYLQHIHKDKIGAFWIGTKDCGLVQWEPGLGQFTQYSIDNGLSDNNIYAVYEDQAGFLWLPTDMGLNRFAPKEGHLRIYTTIDGLPDNEFNAWSHYQAPNGRLFFGGLNGVISFDPNTIPVEEVVACEMQVQSARTIVSSKLTDITELLKIDSQTTVDIDNDYLELSFSNRDCPFPSVLKAQYKIEGIDRAYQPFAWPMLELINLPKGQYTFLARIQNIDGSWANLDQQLTLRIRSSQLSRFSTYTLVALLIAFLIAGMFLWSKYKVPASFTRGQLPPKAKRSRPSSIPSSDHQTASALSPEQQLEKTKPLRTQDEEWLEQLKYVILENLSDAQFSVKVLAEHTGLSERHLLRKIKKITGSTTNEYILELKLLEAQKLLLAASPSTTLKEISQRSGFSSSDYFSRTYKKRFGITPTALLKEK